MTFTVSSNSFEDGDYLSRHGRSGVEHVVGGRPKLAAVVRHPSRGPNAARGRGDCPVGALVRSRKQENKKTKGPSTQRWA
jgi:hypothetical protein